MYMQDATRKTSTIVIADNFAHWVDHIGSPLRCVIRDAQPTSRTFRTQEPFHTSSKYVAGADQSYYFLTTSGPRTVSDALEPRESLVVLAIIRTVRGYHEPGAGAPVLM